MTRLIDSVRRLYFASRKLRLGVQREALVLEVGSGDSPCPRSDVLLDMTLENHERVGGRTIIDRPAVLGLIEKLPFRDQAFDFVIAFHVLEHSANPVDFLAELQRVAKAGYIETPSLWVERFCPLTMHRLEVGLEKADGRDRLLIYQKSAAVPDPNLASYGQRLFHSGGAFHRLPPDALVTRYWWSGHIDYRIANPQEPINWSPPPEVTRGDDYNPRSRPRRWAIKVLQRLRSRRSIDLESLLRCPDCGHTPLAGSLTAEDLNCPACRRHFDFTAGVPNLHPQKAVPDPESFASIGNLG